MNVWLHTFLTSALGRAVVGFTLRSCYPGTRWIAFGWPLHPDWRLSIVVSAGSWTSIQVLHSFRLMIRWELPSNKWKKWHLTRNWYHVTLHLNVPVDWIRVSVVAGIVTSAWSEAWSKRFLCTLQDVNCSVFAVNNASVGTVTVVVHFPGSSLFSNIGVSPDGSLAVRLFVDEQVSGSWLERWGRTPWSPLAPVLSTFDLVFSTAHVYPSPKTRSPIFLGDLCHVL
jgi:hypothetical protein